MMALDRRGQRNKRSASVRDMKLAGLFFALTLSSCVSTTFEPWSAVQHYPKGDAYHAVRIFEGDLPLVLRAGGRVVGTIKAEGSGRGVNDDDLIKHVTEDAPDNGGTHFFVTSTKIDRYITAAGAITPAYQGLFVSSHEDHEATAVVLRVEPERWGELPKEIRPSHWLYDD